MKSEKLLITYVFVLGFVCMSMYSEKNSNSSIKAKAIEQDNTFYCFCLVEERSQSSKLIVSNIVKVVTVFSRNTNAGTEAAQQFEEALKAEGVDYNLKTRFGRCFDTEEEAGREKRKTKGDYIKQGYSIKEFQFSYYNED
jgi:hypothetical protein